MRLYFFKFAIENGTPIKIIGYIIERNILKKINYVLYCSRLYRNLRIVKKENKTILGL